MHLSEQAANRLELLLNDVFDCLFAYGVDGDEEASDLAEDVKAFLRHFEDAKQEGA